MSWNFISIFLSTFAYYDYVASVWFNYTDFGNAWLREEPLQIVSQLTHVKRIFAFICEYKHLVYVCKGRVVERQRREKRNSGCRTRSQIGRIRWIFNRRNPISPAPENGMSSFPSALSLPKIRGIPPIKIRIFDYGRFSHPFSVTPLFLSSSVSSLSLSVSVRLQRHPRRKWLWNSGNHSTSHIYITFVFSLTKRADLN